MEWFRVYHGMPQDAKLQVIAKRTKQPMSSVVSVWLCLLEAASRHEPRGIAEVDPEQIAVVQDMEMEVVQGIIQAFSDKGMIDKNNRLTAWDKRQYATSTERSRKFREEKKQDATPCNTKKQQATSVNSSEQKSSKKRPDTESDTDTDSRTDSEKEKNTDKKNREREEKEEREKEKHKIAEQMLQIWNAEVQSKLTKDQKAILTPQRKELLCKRWEEDFQQDFRAWQYYCEVIGSSDFCLGKIEGKGWTIDLTWAIQSSEHVAKILEGGFSGGKHPPKPPACDVPALQGAWDSTMLSFQKKYGKPIYRSWLSSLTLSSLQYNVGNSSVIIKCSNKFVRDWIAQHYLADLKFWLVEAAKDKFQITEIQLIAEVK